jgi:O-antigen ligase
MARQAQGQGLRAIEASALVATVVLPVSVFVSSRSAPLILTVAALFAAVGLLHEQRFGEFVDRMRAALNRAPFVALRVFLLFFLVSLLWSAFPRQGATAYGELIASLAPGLFLGLAWSIVPPRRLGVMLASGLFLAGALTVADLRTDQWFRRMLGIREAPYVLNRTVVTLLILSWPMLLLVPRKDRLLSLSALGMVGLAIWHSESGAARLGLLAALAAAALAAWSARLAAATLAGGTVFVLAVSPWIGRLMDMFLPAAMHKAMYGMHSEDRVNIWRSFGAAVEQRFWLGSGFNASSRMADDPVAALVAEPNRVLLGSGHPHNALLQVWVEGGLVGALLLAVMALIAGRVLAGLRARTAVAAAAMTGAILSIATVSHGAWQGWWIAVLALGATLLAQETKGQANG